MRIEGKHIVIRSLERKDAPNLLCVAHEPSSAKLLPDWSEDRKTAEDYFDLIDSQQLRSGVYYAIVLPAKDELMGMVGLRENAELNEIELVYFLSDAYKGCGYTKEAVALLSDWCIKHHDLPYLVYVADESNASAGRLVEKCGFALYEQRVTVSHRMPGMHGDHYYYFRKY